MLRALRWLIACVAVLCALALAIYTVLLPPEPMQVPERGFALQNVILVVPGEYRSAPVDIRGSGGVIESIQSSTGGPSGGYVLPGLVDVHMHAPMLPFPGEEELHSFLYLYHGVTGVRMAAGDGAIRDALAAGAYPGPRMLSCGPFVDGEPPLWPDSAVITEPARADALVTAIAQAGYDCVKVYNELTADVSQAIYLAAAVHGLPVIGHVPWRQDATQAWIDDHQHMLGLPAKAEAVASAASQQSSRPDSSALNGSGLEGPGLEGPGADSTDTSHRKSLSRSDSVRAMLQLNTLDAQRISALAQSMVATGTALTPTLITLQRKWSLARYAQLADSRAARLLPHYYRLHLWHPERGLVSARLLNPSDHAAFEALYPGALVALVALHEQGVALHTGTDSPAEFIVPGAGLVEELGLLSGAGLSAEQVLHSSAVTSARALFGERSGHLLEGAPADFVVYADDPTTELAHLASRTMVVQGGRVYGRAELEAQLAAYQEWYDGTLYRAVTESLVRGFLAIVALADR